MEMCPLTFNLDIHFLPIGSGFKQLLTATSIYNEGDLNEGSQLVSMENALSCLTMYHEKPLYLEMCKWLYNKIYNY